MFSAVSSGSGKTMITCGILQALINRNLKVASFKCGPDYIDPMFHSQVIGAKSRNLDNFFTDDKTTNYLLYKNSKNMDISIIEGVMGYYDGLGGISSKSSSYDIAKITKTPVVLIVNCKGMSLSIIPIIKGFIEYKKDSNIKGVILNQMSPMIYGDIKERIEQELNIKVLGYVPVLKDLIIESRHLGLVTPNEIVDLNMKLNKLSVILEETIEIDEIIKISRDTEDLTYEKPNIPKVSGNIKIAVAKDQAFSFYYEDNLELLKEMGAEIIYFSPIADKILPRGINGLIIGGGYPELYAEELNENHSMRESIKEAINNGLPCIAECGGFMYLNKSIENDYNKIYEMVGVIEGEAYKMDKLSRFGYITIKSLEDNFLCRKGEEMKAHEFHYYDSTLNGESFHAQKPLRKKNWNCINTTDNLFAGFPHIYFYSNLNIPFRFLQKSLEYGDRIGADTTLGICSVSL